MENGRIILIGATTENPSFEVNAPLLSRMKVLVLKPLEEETILEILRRAVADEKRGLGNRDVEVPDDLLRFLSSMSQGDVRFSLNVLELAVESTAPDRAGKRLVERDGMLEAMQKSPLLYDRAGEEHFNTISAVHKSLRDSDPDAAIYWIMRMLEAGEDPLYIIRRLVRFATEDIGLADPGALTVAIAAKETVHFIGMPEGALAVLEAAVYLACAPKSNALYAASSKARKVIEKSGALPVPLHIRNAPTGLMGKLGYGKGYKYAHDQPESYAVQDHLPEKIRGEKFYKPGKFGFEKEISKRLAWWASLRNKQNMKNPEE